MFSSFFIDRPRFAMVISAVIMLAGALAIRVIPVAQYPQITPPEVQVSATYAGANADVVADTVAAPIEAQVNGTPGMLYMSSSSTDTGAYSLTVTFDIGTNPDIAQVNVQNRVALAQPRLPTTVTQQGVTVRTRSTNMLLSVNVFSPKGTRDPIFITNYAAINLQEPIARIPGVGDTTIFGGLTYAMRIWMNPDRMQALGISAADLTTAIQQQNIQASAGQIGSPPNSDPNQQQQLTVLARGRLADPREFENIIVRTNANGALLRVRDIARVELGAQSYDARSELNGKPSATLVIYQSPTANALQVADSVRAELARLSQRFPEDVTYEIVFDTTRVVTETLHEILITLAITFGLVVVVTFLFLQEWRATLIPTLTIPVSLIGGFAIFYAAGFSANTITLFALILAIGLVVDDAIIVVENVQRNFELDPTLSAAEATRRAMAQISGPVIASTLVLAAVFVPVAFLPGITGQLYRQFAVTITVTVLLSALNALTLSPALCALLLKPPTGERRGPLRWFNIGVDRSRNVYVASIGRLARGRVVGLAVVIAAVLGAGWLFRTLPAGFIPGEDQGYFFVNIQLPNAASLGRTEAVVGHVGSILRDTPGVADVITVAGSSLVGGAGSNLGLAIAVLKPWGERSEPNQQLDGILQHVREQFVTLPEAMVVAFSPPAIPGLGTTGGFDFRLQALGGQSAQDLSSTMRGLIVAANQDPALSGVFSTFTAEVPKIFVDLDRDKAQLLGVSPGDVFATLQAHLGSQYVNDFNIFSRVFQVRVQDDDQFRAQQSEIDRLHVRSRTGALVPLRTLLTRSTVLGATVVNRYNQFPNASINGQPGAGRSTGDALAAMERAALQLPAGYGFEWTGLAYQQRQTGNQVIYVAALSLVFAYLFLVAQYESWSVPISVILSVSVGVVGALGALWIAHIDVNVYAQIGLVLLIGLAAKNAILIVEFSQTRRVEGASIVEAAEEGLAERFRPVLMTAFAFILGVVPLVIATGAGAASRRSIGTTVFGGMIVATLLGAAIIPLLYILVQSLRERIKGVGRTGGPAAGQKPVSQSQET